MIPKKFFDWEVVVIIMHLTLSRSLQLMLTADGY